jgi:hypothetical protein
MIRMPGKSFHGTAAPLDSDEEALRDELIAHVRKLGDEIGERNLSRYAQLQAAAQYIESSFSESGWKLRRDEYEVQGKVCYNIEAELRGRFT